MLTIANATGIEDASPPSSFLNTPSPAAVILPVLAFTAVVLDSPCFVWHISNRNLPASLLVGWIILQNVITFVNALIWPTDDVVHWWQGQGYCDVVVKLDFASGAAIGASTMCIMRALAAALDTSRPVVVAANGGSSSRSQWLRRNLLVLLLCIMLPMYIMVATYIVQSARYYIFGISGCLSAIYHSVATVFLCCVPLIALMLATCYYAVLVIIRLKRYRTELATVLASTESGLSKTRFVRLLGLSLVLLVIYAPLFAYITWTDVSDTLYPFSWSVVHDPHTAGRIILVQTYGTPRIESWTRITIGFVVFACFGFGKDIKQTYRRVLERLGLARIFPYLWLDDNDPRSAGHRRQRTEKHQHLGSSSAASSADMLKGRAKRIISKLSLSSPSSSSSSPFSPPLEGSNGSMTRGSNITNLGSPISGGHCVSSPITASVTDRRPTGLLEQELHDSDRTVATSSAGKISRPMVVVTRPASDLRVSFASTGPGVPVTQPQPSLQRPAPRSRFWQLLGTYVNGMGPRTTPNLGIEMAHTPYRNGVVQSSSIVTGCQTIPAGDNGASLDYFEMRDRDYEAYILGRLA